MRPAAPTHAVVAIAALDLRRRPDHRSELRSQLLLGEVVRRLETRSARWWRVENLADGYRGWVRTWGLVPADERRVRGWARKATARVVGNYVEVRADRGSGALVSPVFWNGRVIPKRITGPWVEAELPDGRTGWAPAEAFALRGASRMDLAERVRELFGTPYLWGGRSPLGIDCSGFTQQVLAEQGIRLPRDADEQYRGTRRIPDGRPRKPGDLVFFGPRRGRISHVGLLLGGGYYAHARGMVKINSLDSHNPLYDKVLDRQVRGFGRPRRRVGTA